MNSVLSQVSYPVFVSGVFVFFIIASLFSFIVGIGLALRSDTMLRFFTFMNKGFSARRVMKPLTMPHYVEPTLLRHPRMLGMGIIFGAITSILLLKGVDADVFRPVFIDNFDSDTTDILAGYTKSFLLYGNVLCVLVGVLVWFFPHLLSTVEAYTDKWYTLRKKTRPLYQPHLEVDKWVLAHPTVSGITLSVLSLGLSVSMYVRL